MREKSTCVMKGLFWLRRWDREILGFKESVRGRDSEEENGSWWLKKRK